MRQVGAHSDAAGTKGLLSHRLGRRSPQRLHETLAAAGYAEFMTPVYVARAGGVVYLVAFLAISAALLLAAGLAALLGDWEDQAALWLTLGLAFVSEALVWLIIPRRYEVWPDSLRIVFPAFQWDIRFETIEGVRETSWWEPYAFAGVRFATSPGQALVVLRREPRWFGRPHIVISPQNRRDFIEVMRRALGASRQGLE